MKKRIAELPNPDDFRRDMAEIQRARRQQIARLEAELAFAAEERERLRTRMEHAQPRPRGDEGG